MNRYREHRDGKKQGIREEAKISWRGTNLNSLKEDLIEDLRNVSDLRARDKIDIFYFDSDFNDWVKCDDVQELYQLFCSRQLTFSTHSS
eukprot:COSAG05_NODE_1715_length_4227_cov_2.194525_2_plen_89_part_00